MNGKFLADKRCFVFLTHNERVTKADIYRFEYIGERICFNFQNYVEVSEKVDWYPTK